jgi:DNA polymerase III gamma/tau subunit
MQSALAFPQPLAEKYRPRKIDAFIGLERVKRVLNAFVAKPFSTAWYFVGPSGLGKTTMALALAAELKGEIHHIPSRNCDLIEIERVCRMCAYVPMAGGYHIIIVDEADQMSAAAQLALLSKLDATAFPPMTIFIFTANTKNLLEPRFLSRCKVLDFEKGTVTEDLPRFLSKIYRREGGKFEVALDRIIEESAGNVRDALGKLEIELLIGNPKGLPLIEEKPATETHPHKCGECGVKYECADGDCRKAYVRGRCPFGGRPPCQGATTEGAERARKGHETRRAKGKGKR